MSSFGLVMVCNEEGAHQIGTSASVWSREGRGGQGRGQGGVVKGVVGGW